MGVAAVLVLMQLPVQVSLRIGPKGLSVEVWCFVELLRGVVFVKWQSGYPFLDIWCWTALRKVAARLQKSIGVYENQSPHKKPSP